jgi:predicted dehydrogenase
LWRIEMERSKRYANRGYIGPSARLPDGEITLHTQPIRWGIIGPGHISAKFATDLLKLDDNQRLMAVASRSQMRAEAFADRFGIARRYSPYNSLVEDPDVDAVYVGTPHSAHYEPALAALRAGKHVLVTKPLTVNATEAKHLIATARDKRVFLMEAMWNRFSPHLGHIRELLRAGAVGEVRLVMSDYCEKPQADKVRMFEPALGGGALLDIGCYCFAFASMVLGRPANVVATGNLKGGVDAQTSTVLQYEGGQLGVVTTSMESVGPSRAFVVGTEGRIELGPVWTSNVPVSLVAPDGTLRERFDRSADGDSHGWMAAEVGRCIRKGISESPIMPLEESLSIMQTIDAVRGQIGMVLPTDSRAT